MNTIYELFLIQVAKQPLEKTSKRQWTAVDHGPIGRADSYQLLAEDGQNAWNLSERTPPEKAKTIIFSDTVINFRPKIIAEFELWDELSAHHPVYLWRGNDVPMREQTLVTNGDEFWKELDGVKIAKKNEIAESLLAQGLNLDEYVIVDTYVYLEFFSELRYTSEKNFFFYESDFIYPIIEYFQSGGLSCQDEVNDEIKKLFSQAALSTFRSDVTCFDSNSVHAALINLTKSRSVKKLVTSLEIFNSLSRVAPEIVILYDIYIKSNVITNLPFSPCKKLTLNIVEFGNDAILDLSLLEFCEEIIINGYCNIDDAPEPVTIGKIIFPEKMKSLIIDGRVLNVKLDCLEIAPGLIDLDLLTNIDDLHQLDMNIKRNLVHLTIRHNPHNPRIQDFKYNDPFADFTSLQSLTIQKRAPSTILPASYWSNLPLSLTTLYICGSVSSTCPDLKKYTNLKSLNAYDSSIDLEYIPNTIERLELRSLRLLSPEIDLSKFPLIKEVSLDGIHTDELSIINPPPVLRILEISSCNMKTIDFSEVELINQLYLNNITAQPGLLLTLPEQVNYLKLHTLPCINAENLKKIYSVELNGSSTIPEKILSSSGVRELKVRSNTCQVINLEKFHSLIRFDAEYNHNLKKIISVPATVEVLNLVENPILEIPDITHLTRLQKTPKIYYTDDLGRLTQHDTNNKFTRHRTPLANDYRLNDANNKSSTSLLEVSANLTPDSMTGGPPPLVDFSYSPAKVTLYAREGVEKSHYRVHVLDEVVFEKSTVYFISSLKSNNLKKLKLQVNPHEGNKTIRMLHDLANQDGDKLVGDMEVTLSPHQLFPLTTKHAIRVKNNLNIYTNNKNLNWFWCETTNQVFIELKNGAPAQLIHVSYSVQSDAGYVMKSAMKDNYLVEVSDKIIIQRDLWDLIDKAVKSKNELSFVLDKHISINAKLQMLMDYCRAFKNESSTASNLNSPAILIHNILNQVGSCRHRSQSFVAIARYLNVRAMMVVNQDHAMVEIPVLESGKRHFYAFDQGGAEMLDLTPADKRVNPFDIKNMMAPSENTTSHTISLPPAQARAKNIFTESRKCESVLPFLQQNNDSPCSPLLMFNQALTPLQINHAIITELSLSSFDTANNYLYIHTPADFTRYLRPIQFSEGKRTIIDGPLRHLLNDGGVLVINWNTFDANQMASYKSILEINGTLKGHKVSPNLRIISLASTDRQEACEAFLSRTTPYSLDKNYCKKRLVAEQTVDNSNLISIDLFGLPNWRERLLGYVHYQDQMIVLDEGPLIKAIRSGAPLQVFNAYTDPELQDLFEKIKAEGRIYFNGEMIPVISDFTYTTLTRENAIESANVKVIADDVDSKQKGIYLNANNLHECYTRMVVDNKRQSVSHLPGWFDNQQHFYISDFISRNAWQELIAHAKVSNKLLTFTLLPGSEIEGVAKSSMHMLETVDSGLLFTNDPDYATVKLAQNEQASNPLIIDITPDTTYQDLIGKMTDARTDDGTIAFSYQYQKMLKALLKGRIVILNGEVSQVLYQQLLPFLHPQHASISLNNVDVNSKGKLILVMPLSAKENLQPGICTTQMYDVNDYLKKFPSEEHLVINKVANLFELASQLSPHGLGQPTAPQLTYQYLKHSLQVLQKSSDKQLHQSNPIKGLLHYDYPKHSKNYAFLNVIAKRLFAKPQKAERQRDSKMMRLIRKYNIATRDQVAQYFWELLNCCDVNAIMYLITIKEDKFNFTFHHQTPIPALEAIDQLYQLITPLIERKPADSITVRHSSGKAIKQLDTLVHGDATRAIFLKGPPGTAKTHSVRELKEQLPAGHYHKGTHHILDWLLAISKDGAPILLHLDEANMYLPGIWDLFKGLFRDGQLQSIYYQGKNYKLSPQHKVLFTGNDESLPGRRFHQFLQNYAETIRFAMPLDGWIKEKFIYPVMRKLRINEKLIPSLADNLLWAFHHIKDYNPNLEISIRDVSSLTQRFALLYESSQQAEISALHACIDEFATTIKNQEKRFDFISELQTQHRIVAIPKATSAIIQLKDICIPASKKYIVDAMAQDLAMCEKASDGRSYRHGILLEGGSGVGKSSLCKALLEEHGYSKDAEDLKRRYYEISVDTSVEVAKTLITAYLQGSKVILDELNLNPRLEGLLNDLLEGALPEDTEFLKMAQEISGKEHPNAEIGFQLFASQNSGLMTGRKPLSPALINRLHLIYVDDYSRADLIAILEFYKIDDATAVVDQYFHEKSMHPELINTRNLFEWMKKQEPAAITDKISTIPMDVNDDPAMPDREQLSNKYLQSINNCQSADQVRKIIGVIESNRLHYAILSDRQRGIKLSILASTWKGKDVSTTWVNIINAAKDKIVELAPLSHNHQADLNFLSTPTSSMNLFVSGKKDYCALYNRGLKIKNSSNDKK